MILRLILYFENCVNPFDEGGSPSRYISRLSQAIAGHSPINRALDPSLTSIHSRYCVQPYARLNCRKALWMSRVRIRFPGSIRAHMCGMSINRPKPTHSPTVSAASFSAKDVVAGRSWDDVSCLFAPRNQGSKPALNHGSFVGYVAAIPKGP